MPIFGTLDIKELTMRGVAVIGAAGGIGQAIAEALLEAGDAVFLLDQASARPSLVALQSTWPDRTLFIACDLADPASIEQAFASVGESEFGLGACINAAGVIHRGPFIDVPWEALDRMLAVNVAGVFQALQAASRQMMATGGGHIVNLASAHGLRTTTERSAYAMCKGAILSLTRALAVELAPHGILVNAVAPGPVAAGMQDARSASRRRWQDATPIGRVATAAEVARAVAWLASPDNTFVTGDTLVIDGGATAALGGP